MNAALVILLAANLALSALFAIVKKARREEIGILPFFIFLPWLGFIFYFTAALVRRFSGRAGVDREAVLTHVFEIERQPEAPDVQEALNVVPVEDAMAVSGNAEKRAFILDQLKRDMHEKYKVLLAAEHDEDSESAHYVAAAKMEIYRLQQARWLECRRSYDEDPDDPATFHGACEALSDMLDGGVLSAQEKSAYRKRLCEIIQRQIDRDEGELTQQEYERYLQALIELGRYEGAEALWRSRAHKMQSEAAYHEMLKMFYQRGDRGRFEQTLDELRSNRHVRLSAEGLEQLRYWTCRLSGAPMGA